MKKSTFLGNLVAWVAIAAACAAFLAWYRMTDFEVVASAVSDSTAVQLGVVLSAPVLVFAIGVVLGLLVLWFKKVTVGRAAKVACRVVSVLALACMALAGLPALVPATGGALLGMVVIVVYVAVTAPILFVALGFVYAVGCAGVDRTKRGPLAKYLPDDEDEKDTAGEKGASSE